MHDYTGRWGGCRRWRSAGRRHLGRQPGWGWARWTSGCHSSARSASAHRRRSWCRPPRRRRARGRPPGQGRLLPGGHGDCDPAPCGGVAVLDQRLVEALRVQEGSDRPASPGPEADTLANVLSVGAEAVAAGLAVGWTVQIEPAAASAGPARAAAPPVTMAAAASRGKRRARSERMGPSQGRVEVGRRRKPAHRYTTAGNPRLNLDVKISSLSIWPRPVRVGSEGRPDCRRFRQGGPPMKQYLKSQGRQSPLLLHAMVLQRL